MNTTTIISKDNKFEIGLNIHLLSFRLPEEVIKTREVIRVSITTFPELNQQHFYLYAKNMNCPNHTFSINITNQTKHFIIHFRKKVFLKENPIIGSKTIHLQHFQCFPKDPISNDIIKSEVKSVNIYYRHQFGEKEIKDEAKYQPIIIGNMLIQLSFTPPYKKNDSKDNNHKIKRKLSINKHEKVANEDEFFVK